MYNQFKKNFSNYLTINNKDLFFNEYRLSILEPFYGLCDIDTYIKWKEDNDIRYYEVSNIIFKLHKSSETCFSQFTYELYGNGYEAIESAYFDNNKVLEQVKLIKLLLGAHYWV